MVFAPIATQASTAMMRLPSVLSVPAAHSRPKAPQAAQTVLLEVTKGPRGNPRATSVARVNTAPRAPFLAPPAQRVTTRQCQGAALALRVRKDGTPLPRDSRNAALVA